MTDLMQKFASLKGAKFVGINGYTNKSGEVSNQIINCNINIENAKKADLETLKNFPASKLNEIATKVGASKEDALRAIEELIVSAERNLTADNRTASSVAQTDAYTQLGKGIKFHNETGDLYITGFANNKTVLVEGEYKKVNSSAKTLVKKAVNKSLKMSKFRSFRLSNIGRELHVTGSTVQL
jgi:hypothetical protein